MRGRSWPSSERTRQSSSGPHPVRETKADDVTGTLTYAPAPTAPPACDVLRLFLSKHSPGGETDGRMGLTLRQFTTAAGWSGMAAV